MTESESNRLPLALGLVLALGLAASPGGARAASLGFIAAVKGEVQVRTGAEGRWGVAPRDRALELGDSLRTGTDSGVKILLADATLLTLGASTELALGPEPGRLELRAGQVRVAGSTPLALHTPTAVIDGQGTSFEAYVVQDDTGTWTRVCDREGCKRVAPGEPAADTPRPNGFGLVPFLSSRPAPGAGELLGPPGVAAGPGAGGKLLDLVVSGVPALDGSSFGESDAELRDPYIEDAQQAATLSDDRGGSTRPEERPPAPPPLCPAPETVEPCSEPTAGAR